jgi:hypothetical protein
VSHRPLAIVSVLTLGDYALWNWSLGANHEVVALVAGLTLPPLGIVFVWLGVLSLGRLLARSTLRSRTRAQRALEALRQAPEHARPVQSLLASGEAGDDAAGSAAAPAAQSRPPDKLAA